MTKGFIKNYELLKEDCKVDDLLDFTSIASNFYRKINSISDSSIITLVGPFGSGKSTMINSIIKTKKDNEKWIEFDAWKYPNRKDLWEGFVLDFARQIDEKTFDKALKTIDGENNDGTKTLINTLGSAPIPGASMIKSFNHFLETSPAKRVFEIQGILTDIINKNVNQNTFIIIEDIDRSGDAGIFFLETLKQFLRTHNFEKRLVVIVPISNDSYYKNLDSYLKCIDYFDFFQPKKLKLEKFVTDTFDENLISNKVKKEQIISFLEGLFKENFKMTLRLLKLIIRKADLNFKNQTENKLDPDFRVTLCFEASKYIDDNEEKSCFNRFKNEGIIETNNIFYSFLYAILLNKNSIYKTKYTESEKQVENLITFNKRFKLIKRLGNNIEKYPSIPWTYEAWENRETEGFGITSFYLDY